MFLPLAKASFHLQQIWWPRSWGITPLLLSWKRSRSGNGKWIGSTVQSNSRVAGTRRHRCTEKHAGTWFGGYIITLTIFGRRCSRHGCSGYWRLSCIVQPRPNTQAIIGGMWPLTAVFQSRIIVEFAIIISFMMFCCWFRVDDHLSCFPVVSKVASMAWHPRLTSVWLRDTEGNCEANRTGARCNMDPTVPLNPWLGVSDLFDVF